MDYKALRADIYISYQNIAALHCSLARQSRNTVVHYSQIGNWNFSQDSKFKAKSYRICSCSIGYQPLLNMVIFTSKFEVLRQGRINFIKLSSDWDTSVEPLQQNNNLLVCCTCRLHLVYTMNRWMRARRHHYISLAAMASEQPRYSWLLSLLLHCCVRLTLLCYSPHAVAMLLWRCFPPSPISIIISHGRLCAVLQPS